MRIFTAHLREDRAPVLLREGFSWLAAMFGPFWLAAHRAWIPVALALAGEVALVLLAPAAVVAPLLLGWHWLLGLFGHDLCRWALEVRGYTLAHVIAARDADSAFARLLTHRPDLADAEIPALRR